ncbi:MAG: HIT family protein [Candidatus Heimdallarchaeota archaeon]|nr:HIT family protein [Candidatus Heimdallarchaeota archaeon]MBY8995121.1 HIT family protein [Candidatus Heimdallarchaeota archaeon]
MNTDCIFCKIVRKEEFAAVLYEDDDVMAFMDIKPINVGWYISYYKKGIFSMIKYLLFHFQNFVLF